MLKEQTSTLSVSGVVVSPLAFGVSGNQILRFLAVVDAEPKCANTRNMEAAITNFMLLNAVRSYPLWCLGEY